MTGLEKGGLAAAKKVLSYLAARLDPKLSKQLDKEITAHLLSEIPRIKRLLEERIEDVVASGCTPEEANIIAHQVIEEQKRTLDEEKRRRLSNVLVNGLCTKKWHKAEHRFMVRLASELEEEHVHVLKQETRFARRGFAFGSLERAIERELIARGLIEEEIKQIRNPKWKEPDPPRLNGHGQIVRQAGIQRERVPEFIDETSLHISQLGQRFLEHLEDPETSASAFPGEQDVPSS